MEQLKGFDILKWGSFKIPGFTLALILLLLLMRDPSNKVEFDFVQQLAKFAMGSSIIGYSHSLMHSNHILLERGKDLPTWIQIGFLLAHVSWFIYWFKPY